MRYVGLFSCISLVPRSNRPGKGHRAPSAICTVSKTHRHFARIEDRHSAFLDTRGCRAVLHPLRAKPQPLRDGGIRAVAPPRTRWAISCFHVPTSQQKAPHQRNRTLPISWVDNSTSKRMRFSTLVRSNRSISSVTFIPRRRTKRFRARQPRGNLSRESRSPQRRGRSRRGWCPVPRRWDSSRP